MRLSRNIALALVCIILGIILATQYKSVYHNKQMQTIETKSLNELQAQIISERKTNDDLRSRNEELLKEVNAYETKRMNNDDTLKRMKEELDRVRMIAGLVEVKGRGVIITVDDNDPIAFVDENNLLDVLNELRASDAQAISINDERITAMTEIRVAGRYIMINKKQNLAPFVVKAIADPDKLEHTLKMIGGVVERLEENWFLNVDVRKSDEVVIPAVPDDGSVIDIKMLSPVEK